MTSTLRYILITGIVIYFFVVYRLLKNKRLNLKYSLLWLFMGCMMALFVLFPKLLEILTGALGIVSQMNGLFTVAIAFAFILLMAITSIVSKQSNSIKELVQNNALLEKRIRELESKESENNEDHV